MEMKKKRKIDHIFKIIIIGDQSVGKTTLLTRFSHNFFNEKTAPTVGLDLFTKKM